MIICNPCGREDQAEGIDLNLITVESGLRHQRMFHYGEYDACEFSMSSYLVARGQDMDWLHAIPFFPRRMLAISFASSGPVPASRSRLT